MLGDGCTSLTAYRKLPETWLSLTESQHFQEHTFGTRQGAESAAERLPTETSIVR